MSEDQFMKLFKHIDKMRGDMNKRFDAQDEKIEDLKMAVAELGGQIRDYIRK